MNNQQKLAEFFAELGFKITGKKELNDYSRMLDKLEKQVSDMTISFSRFNETVQKGLARTQLAQLRDLRIRKAKLELQKAEYDASMKQARLDTQRAKTKAVADKTLSYINNTGLIAMGKVNHMNIMTDLARVRQQEAAVTRELKQQRQERNANDIIAQRQARTSAQIATQEARTATELARQQAVRARMALLGSRGASGGGSGGRGGVALGSAFGAASGALAGFLPGFGIAYSAMNLNRINQELQANQMALTAITGDEASARDTDLRFRQRANALGIDWRATQPSFRKMLASGLGSGMSQGDVEGIFQGTAEYGRVMGLGTEDMKGTFRAIEQMMN